MKKILVVGAHPDDEIIGLGGTLARHVSCGDQVSVLILSNGHGSREDAESTANIEKRLEALNQSSKIIGIKDVIVESYPDQYLDTVPLVDMTKSIERHARSINPDIVYFHHHGDLNYDHQVVYRACITAFRPVGDYPSRLLSYETFSSTEWGSPFPDHIFNPNYFVDISDHYEQKMEALKCYSMELRRSPHPRSLESIEVFARKWGSVIGVTYAEAFALIREVVRG